jgi:hypothetical protein
MTLAAATQGDPPDSGHPEPVWICANHALMPPRRTAFHRLNRSALPFVPPEGPADPDRHLPDPWDQKYREVFRQQMQPVKLWSNANGLAEEIEAAAAPEAPPGAAARAAAARAVAEAMIARMRDFTVPADPAQPDGAAFLESRFDYTAPGLFIPGPWVSAIANAFAILASCRLHEVLPNAGLATDIRRLGDAYLMLRHETRGQIQPERWISYLDAEGHLWFDEYPLPQGRATLVLNGHVFAVLALHQAAGLWPERGYQALVQGGVASVEANFRKFLHLGQPNHYSLRGPRRGDYLPSRTIRQQYELFLLTGAPVFVKNARLALADCGWLLDPEKRRVTEATGRHLIARRSRFDGCPPVEARPQRWRACRGWLRNWLRRDARAARLGRLRGWLGRAARAAGLMRRG